MDYGPNWVGRPVEVVSVVESEQSRPVVAVDEGRETTRADGSGACQSQSAVDLLAILPTPCPPHSLCLSHYLSSSIQPSSTF